MDIVGEVKACIVLYGVEMDGGIGKALFHSDWKSMVKLCISEEKLCIVGRWCIVHL